MLWVDAAGRQISVTDALKSPQPIAENTTLLNAFIVSLQCLSVLVNPLKMLLFFQCIDQRLL